MKDVIITNFYEFKNLNEYCFYDSSVGLNVVY